MLKHCLFAVTIQSSFHSFAATLDYTINDLEAAYVRKMFACALDRRGFKDLIAEMKANGITGKRGKETSYNNLLANLSAAVLPPEVVADLSAKMHFLKAEIAELKEAEPPADYSVDTIREWLNAIRTAPDSKAIHLLIARIEAKREDNKTDFKIESTLKPVLEKVSCAPEKDISLAGICCLKVLLVFRRQLQFFPCIFQRAKQRGSLPARRGFPYCRNRVFPSRDIHPLFLREGVKFFVNKPEITLVAFQQNKALRLVRGIENVDQLIPKTVELLIIHHGYRLTPWWQRRRRRNFLLLL